MITLVSYPRSGCTWFRYMTEYLTQRPTQGQGSKALRPVRTNHVINPIILRERPIGETFNIGVDLEALPILKKDHLWHKASIESDRAILLLRNPVDAISRFTQALILKEAEQYAYIVREAHSFGGDLLVLTFEELTGKTLPLEKICDYLGEGHARIESFEKDLEAHRARSQMMYDNADRLRRLSYTPTDGDRETWMEWFRNSDVADFIPYLQQGA